MSIILIALFAALAWAVKDAIKVGSVNAILTGWKKYVGCLVAGIAYGYLSNLKFFHYVAVVAVVALVGNSFNDVWTFLTWVKSKFSSK